MKKQQNKFTVFLLIIIISTTLAGIYGIIHDIITYSISKEYFTKLKFIQFRIQNWGFGKNIGTSKSPEIILQQPLFGVSIVGFLATWWVGTILGVILSFTGLIHKDASHMFKTNIKIILNTLIIAFISGIGGLFFGYVYLLNNSPNWFFPDNLINKTNFILVGSIHNFSYIGGFIGLIYGVIKNFKSKNV